MCRTQLKAPAVSVVCDLVDNNNDNNDSNTDRDYKYKLLIVETRGWTVFL